MGAVARGAYGSTGRLLVDGTTASLLLGVCIAYQVAASSFMLSDPELDFTGTALGEALGGNAGALFFPLAALCLFSDLASLSKFSAMGLVAIAFSFVVIVYHGLSLNGTSGFTTSTFSEARGGTLTLLPPSFSTFAVYYGTASFCFGITPVTFSMKSSMKDPTKMAAANRLALLCTYTFYAIVGTFVILLYSPPNAPALKGDILAALPPGSPLTLAVRASMIVVCVVSYPLCLVPCADIITAALLDAPLLSLLRPSPLRFFLRLTLVTTTTLVAAKIPSFVLVVSLIGCFCVGVVSFVFPPLFHRRLVGERVEREERGEREGGGRGREGGGSFVDAFVDGGGGAVGEGTGLLPKSLASPPPFSISAARRSMKVDALMVAVGVVSTFFTTALTLRTIAAQWSDPNSGVGEDGGEALRGFGGQEGGGGSG